MAMNLCLQDDVLGVFFGPMQAGIRTDLDPNEVYAAEAGVLVKRTLAKNDMLICKEINVGTVQDPVYELQLQVLVAPVDPVADQVAVFNASADPHAETNIDYQTVSFPSFNLYNGFILVGSDDGTPVPLQVGTGQVLVGARIDNKQEIIVQTVSPNGILMGTGDQVTPLMFPVPENNKLIVGDTTNGIASFTTPQYTVVTGDAGGVVAVTDPANPLVSQVFANNFGTIEFAGASS